MVAITIWLGLLAAGLAFVAILKTRAPIALVEEGTVDLSSRALDQAPQ